MEIGLFPLGIVLLPTEQVRSTSSSRATASYRRMRRRRSSRSARLRGRRRRSRATGTLASVVEVVDRFEDGRLNIVVEGGERFRLLELTDGRAFHTGTVEPLADNDDPPDPDDVTRGIRLFAQLVELTGADVEAPARTSGSRRSPSRPASSSRRS